MDVSYVLLHIYMQPPHGGQYTLAASSLLTLAPWRFYREKMYRCTRRDIATCVVTEIIRNSHP